MSPRPRIKSGLLDLKYEKAQEKIKESFWGDFLFGGLLVSGIFIIVDNLNLPQEVSINIGVINICLALSLMLGRLRWLKINKYRIYRLIDKIDTSYKTKQYKKSIIYLEKIIKISPKFIAALFNKGVVLDNLGKEEEAIEVYEKVIEIDHKFKEAWFNKGITLLKLGRLEDALECFGKVINIYIF